MAEEHVRPEHDQYGQRNGHREPHKVKGRLVRHVVGDLLGRLGRLRDPLVLPVAHVGPTAAVVEVLGAERRVDALGVVALARVGEATLHRHFDLVCRKEFILKYLKNKKNQILRTRHIVGAPHDETADRFVRLAVRIAGLHADRTVAILTRVRLANQPAGPVGHRFRVTAPAERRIQLDRNCVRENRGKAR